MANTDALFSDAASQAQSTSNDALSRLQGVTSTVVSQAQSVATRVLSAVTTTGNTVVTMVQGVLARVVSTVTTIATSAINTVRTVLGVVTSTIQTIVGGVVGGLVGAVRLLFGVASTAVRMAVGLVNAVVSLFTMGWQAVVAAASMLVHALPLVVQIVQQAVSLVSAVAGVVSAIWNAVAPMAVQAVGMVRQGFLTAWSAISSAFSTVSEVARSVAGTVASWASSAYSWITDIVSRNAGSIVSAMGSLASTALKAGGALLQVVGAGTLLAAFSGAVLYAANSALDFARSAKNLSSITGFGIGKSAGIIDRLGIQGISPDAIQSVFSNASPFAATMKAQAFGLSGGPDSEGFLASLSKRFQGLNSSGPTGSAMAQSMMKSLGLNSEWMRAAMTSPATQRANATYQRTIDSNLGLSPTALKEYGEAVPAMIQRISYGIQKALLFLANTVLPIVENVLGVITKTIGQNSGNIASFIQGAVRFMFVKAGPMFMEGLTTLVAMIATGVQKMLEWATWLVTTLPGALEYGGQLIANTLRAWSQNFIIWSAEAIAAFGGFLQGMGNALQSIVAGIGSFVVGSLTRLADFLLSVATDSNNPFRVLALEIAKALDAVSATLGGFINGVAVIAAALYNAFWGAVRGIPMIGQWAARNHQPISYSAANNTIPQSNLYGTLNGYFTGPGFINASRSVRGASVDAQNWFDTVQGRIGRGTTNLVKRATNTATDVANAVGGGLNGVGDFLASTDGKKNLGRDLGQGIADLVRPALDPLSRISQGVTDFSSAAQAYKQSLGTEKERGERWDKLITLQEEANRTSLAIKENLQKNGSFGGRSDRVAGSILSEYSAARSAALKRRA